MIPTTHNIRRPALWLVLTCLAAVAFLFVTDPRAGLAKTRNHDGYSVNEVDAVHQAHVGTVVGVAGAALILAVALFLCTAKGSPPTGPSETTK